MSGAGLLLIAHGARDPRWAAPFEAVAARVRALRPGCRVELAYLEFIAPDLPAAAARLAEAGCTRIEVVPLFLGAGGHVRKDLPAMIEAFGRAHPALRLTLHPAVGEAANVIDAMADAAALSLR